MKEDDPLFYIDKIINQEYDLDEWHQEILDSMSRGEETHHSTPTDRTYYAWWLDRAIYYNHGGAINSILDRVLGNTTGLSLKERIAMYELLGYGGRVRL